MKQKSSQNRILVFITIVIIFALAGCGSGGGSVPLIPSYLGGEDYSGDALDYAEGKAEFGNENFIPGEYEYDNSPKDYDNLDPYYDKNRLPTKSSSYSACPTGCTTHIVGCDIKGNISINGERIYHLPNQLYYAATVIEPIKGERWFCTEIEAQINGWRKSKK